MPKLAPDNPNIRHSIGDRLECRFSFEGKQATKCRVCGGCQQRQITDLPFKTGSSIVIVKALPVLQCGQCSEMELENETMVAVEALLSRVSASAELSVLHFAA